MDSELLGWFSNFINFMILAYISVSLVDSNCFNVSQLSLSLFGLVASILANITSILMRTK